mgnify:CR=1 FL=1
MKTLTRAEAAGFLLANDNFCILTHRRPDGDTLGSAAALCLGLRQLGKSAWVLNPPEPLDNLDWLMCDITTDAVPENAAIVAVDVAAPNMLPRDSAEAGERIKLRIDHHGSGREYTPRELVMPEMAACTEIIWEVLLDMGVELDAQIASALYVGTATDTGCFRFANTNAHTFDVAADCSAAGADVFGWNLRLFESNSLEKLRLQAWVTEHVKIFGDGKLALCALPKAVEEQLGVDEDDLGNLCSFLRCIEGVCMAALLRQPNEEFTRASLRAIPGYDAAAFGSQFGGGGHAGAAGCSLNLPLQEAAVVMEKAMTEWVMGQ